MKLKIPALFVIVLLTVSACKKNQDTSNKIYLLNQVIQTTGSSTVVITMKYDDQNHLIEYYDDSANKNDCKFSYDNSDRLIGRNISNFTPASANNQVASGTSVSDYTYTYLSATTVNAVVVYKFNGTTSSTNTQVFTLNDKQQVTKLDYGTTLSTISIYTYDSAGNRLTQSDYSNGSATPGYVFAYTYDQNKSYFTNVKGNVLTFALNPGINNTVKETYTGVTPNITYTFTYTSTFEYNSDGYPTKETRVQTRSDNTLTSTQTFTYSYIVK